MLCYFVFWSIQVPILVRFSANDLVIIVPAGMVALLIWAFVKVPPKSWLFSRKAELSGSELSWAWLGAFNSAVGTYATLGVNIPDFTVGLNLPYRVVLVCETNLIRDMLRTKERA